MQFLYTKLTLYIFWKNLCHFFCQFFSLFEGRGRGRQHIYARLGTGCRDLQCCHQLCGEGKDTADTFAFDVLHLLGFVGSKTGRNPKKTRFFDKWLQSIFWFLLLWRVHWHELRVNCDELRLLSQKWIQDFHQTGCTTNQRHPVAAYRSTRMWQSSISLFAEMPQRAITPNPIAFTAAMTSAEWRQAVQLLQDAYSESWCCWIGYVLILVAMFKIRHVATPLLHFDMCFALFVTCSLVCLTWLDVFQTVKVKLNETIQIRVTSFLSLQEMQWKSKLISAVTFGAVANAAARDGQWQVIFQLLDEMQNKQNVEARVGKRGRCRKTNNKICRWLQFMSCLWQFPSCFFTFFSGQSD